MERPDFFLCYFETTRRCDQGCPNCMTRLAEGPARDELTTSEAKHLVLDELAEICPRGAVSFSGGEILQRRDHLELIEHNAGNRLYSFVNTSGAGLDAAELRALERAAAGAAPPRAGWAWSSVASPDLTHPRVARSGSGRRGPGRTRS